MTQDKAGECSASLRKGAFLPLLGRGARTSVSGHLGFPWAKGQVRGLWFPKSGPEAGPVPDPLPEASHLSKPQIRLQTIFPDEVKLVFAFVKGSHLSPANILKVQF